MKTLSSRADPAKIEAALKRIENQTQQAKRRLAKQQAAPGADARLALLEDTIKGPGEGIIKFAKTLRVSPQAVAQWKAQRFVPLPRAIEIERLFGVPRDRLISPKVTTFLDDLASDASDLL